MEGWGQGAVILRIRFFDKIESQVYFQEILFNIQFEKVNIKLENNKLGNKSFYQCRFLSC